MVQQVSEQPHLTLPTEGNEAAFVAQLISQFRDEGSAINVLLRSFEVGTFTPLLSFNTPGDLSVSYATQTGQFRRIGNLVYVAVDIKATPTFSTASGDLKVTDLPFPLITGSPTIPFPVRLLATGITWPASATDVVAFMRANQSSLQIAAQGSAATGSNIKAVDVTSAVQITILVSGVYIVDAESA